jgi:hypothetical protein
MAEEFQCPTCGQDLAVRAGTPPGTLVTCPRCLASLAIPYPPASSATTPTRKGPPPLPVMPLETEVRADQRGVTRSLLILAILLIVGGFLSLFSRQPGVGAMMILSGIALGIVVSIMRATAERRAAARSRSAPPSMPITPGGVLPYGHAERPEALRAVGAFVSGFFVALGLCAGCVVLMAATFDAKSSAQKGTVHTIVIVAIVIAIAGLIVLSRILAKRNIWIGFGRGIAIGLALGLMAVGPCALCYVSM